MARLLTELTIKAMRAPETGQIEIADRTDVKGLTLRVSQSGAKAFYLVYRSPVDRKQARVKLGTHPALKLADAREKARHYRGLVERGIDPRTQEKADAEERKRAAIEAAREAEHRSHNTFGMAADDFITRCQRAGLRRWRERRRHFDVYTPRDWQERQVTSISRDDLKALLAKIERNHGPVMANRVIETIRTLLNWLIAEGRLDNNPAARLQSDRPERSRDRVLTDAELAAVWHATGPLGDPFGPFVRMVILTAQRRHEVATMRTCDIDADGIWNLRAR